jgi:hypothetical protein
MKRGREAGYFIVGSVFLALPACSAHGYVGSPSGSEVATSVVSGALNNNSGSAMAWNAPIPRRRSLLRRAADAVNPIGTAWGASWTCTGGSLSPAFAGPGANPYAYTPLSCSVTWGNDRTASSSWSGAFTLVYGAQCDSTHAFIENQTAGCVVTRTTDESGNTRRITGPDGNAYAIDHDTNGANTGWDTSVTPPPTSAGVDLSPSLIVVHGSHLTGTVTYNGKSMTIWDHTVSTGEGGITITGTGTGRIINGSVVVQHNLAKFTTTTTFAGVGYEDGACCFPTAGVATTAFNSGPRRGLTESLTFSRVCGEATLRTADGDNEAITLQHCL